MLDTTKIPSPIIPIIEDNGRVSVVWYRFFYNLFDLTASGSTMVNLQDLQLSPPVTQINEDSSNFNPVFEISPQYKDESGVFDYFYQQSQLASIIPSSVLPITSDVLPSPTQFGTMSFFNLEGGISTLGGILYGTGSSIGITQAGTAGQILTSQGTNPPTWSNPAYLQFLTFDGSGNFAPTTDNTQNFGSASLRWSVLYAGTGTINTSDESEKMNIRPLNIVEKTVARRLKKKIKSFVFKSAHKVKKDKARVHFGIIAQDVERVFKEEGLNADDYGIFCRDVYTDLNGFQNTKLGIRYDELLCFIISTL